MREAGREGERECVCVCASVAMYVCLCLCVSMYACVSASVWGSGGLCVCGRVNKLGRFREANREVLQYISCRVLSQVT